MNNRDKILKEALNLFSNKGYDSVSVREIAKAVGIKESSLYNHFKNKQDIFDCIIKEYSARMEEFFYKNQLTGEDKQIIVDQRTVDMYKEMEPEQFEKISSKIFEFYFMDEINVKLRRMLTIEQFRNEEISKTYREMAINSGLEFQAKLFEEMIREGCFIEVDPYILALQFFSPIFLLFYKFENDEDSLAAAKNLFVRHIKHFHKTYTRK